MLAEVAAWLRHGGSVVVLTGAGISTDSGIPDFRGPQGLWTKDPSAERLSSLQAYLSDPEVRVRAWRARLEHPAWTAAPGPGHVALAELERKGHLDTLITQNVDGLHQRAGSSRARLIEIHGSLREVVCMSCGERGPMEAALERVRAGETDPGCLRCGGILKSATISFGQALAEQDLERARAAARRADVFMAVGTSLAVFPVAYLPQVALDHGARLVIVNAEPTGYDGLAHALLRGQIAELLPALAELV